MKYIKGMYIEESKPKLRLIDILNKIANGELKEGTKVIFEDIELIYKNGDLEHEDGYSICCIMHNSKDLLSEVELIEPHQFREDTKMIEPTDNTKIEELDVQWMLYQQSGTGLSVIVNKLNEVIRYINKGAEE